MDYNFFDSYEKPVKKTNYLTIVLIVVGVLVLAALGAMTFINTVTVASVKAETNKIQEQMASEVFQKALEEVDELEKIEENSTMVLSNFKEFEKAALLAQTVNTKVLDKITNSLPSDVSVNSINLGGNAVNLVGTSTTKLGIAKYEENLRNCEYFENLRVSTISMAGTENEASYNYAASFDLNLSSLVPTAN